MKKLLSLLTLSLALLVACSKADDTQKSAEPTLTILSEQPLDVDFRGGKVTIPYEIANPQSGVELAVSCTASWVSELMASNGVSTFVAERNSGSTPREAAIIFTYGDMEQSLLIKQGIRPEGGYDYDMQATVFGGEYYGMGLNDNFNYYVQVGDSEINESNNIPNGTYYYFDIYAKHRGGDHPILPNGTYTLANNEDNAIGTFTAKESKAHINNELGEVETEFTMVNGSVTVTDNKFEAVIYMSDGTIHRILYEGELHVPYAVFAETPEVGSSLTEDLVFDHNAASIRLFYYGDYYECGKDYWSIALMETVYPINGDYVMVDIITDGLNEGADVENIYGTYTACSDLDIKENSFLSGIMEGAMYLYSWRLICEDDYIVNGNGRVPVSDGTITVEPDGSNVIVTFDCVDDANHKVHGAFVCGYPEIYDRSKR